MLLRLFAARGKGGDKNDTMSTINLDMDDFFAPLRSSTSQPAFVSNYMMFYKKLKVAHPVYDLDIRCDEKENDGSKQNGLNMRFLW
ncbi:hypothetical protein ACFX19_034351 [Malus domestica]